MDSLALKSTSLLTSSEEISASTAISESRNDPPIPLYSVFPQTFFSFFWHLNQKSMEKKQQSYNERRDE